MVTYHQEKVKVNVGENLEHAAEQESGFVSGKGIVQDENVSANGKLLGNTVMKASILPTNKGTVRGLHA